MDDNLDPVRCLRWGLGLSLVAWLMIGWMIFR